jgi:hypothetical protein
VAEDRLYPSPRNAVREPIGKDRKFGRSVRIAVVARLIWPRNTTIVPATVVWISDDRVCIEWLPRPESSTTRRTWLHKKDVRTRLTYPS